MCSSTTEYGSANMYILCPFAASCVMMENIPCARRGFHGRLTIDQPIELFTKHSSEEQKEYHFHRYARHPLHPKTKARGTHDLGETSNLVLADWTNAHTPNGSPIPVDLCDARDPKYGGGFQSARASVIDMWSPVMDEISLRMS